MNKKVVKYVLIVSGIVLLLGLGIWGYKYIKNRNDDKKTNENETDLKELANLTSYGTSSVVGGSFTLNYYYNGPINMGKTCDLGITGLNDYNNSVYCFKYNFYLTIYVNDSIKLKSSWLFSSYEYNLRNSVSSYTSKMKKIVTTNVLNSKFLVISLSKYTACNGQTYNDIVCNTMSVSYFPYTKVFDATTGDMIFAVPTNSNETLTAPSGTYGTCTKFTNNMCLTDSNALYYLKSVYVNGSSKVEVHKVTFSDSFANKYKDEVV